MAVFPRKPDLQTTDEAKEYIRYMVERIEFAAANIEKRLDTLETAQGENGGN